jgi:hypothetical protein
MVFLRNVGTYLSTRRHVPKTVILMLTAISTIQFHTQHNPTVRYGVWLRPAHHISTQVPGTTPILGLLQGIVDYVKPWWICPFARNEGVWYSGSVSSIHSYIRQWTGCVTSWSATRSSQFSYEEEPCYPLQKRTAGPLSRSRHFGEEISFLPLPAARGLGQCTVLTELSEYDSCYSAGLSVTCRIRRLEHRNFFGYPRRLNHSSPSSAEFNNKWSCTSAPSVFLRGVEENSFALRVRHL